MPVKPRPVRLSPLALTDLEEIWLYTLKTWSLDQADRYGAEFIAAFNDLASGRSIGRSVPEREGYLKHPVGSHFIFYTMLEDQIDIIRILHQRMNAASHL